jgi:alkanesulfonate monooxygenase SsuD/methylene tetrahydromethanopterin reductase-like flavin-dependent oxidoreductase (luciferase family)
MEEEFQVLNVPFEGRTDRTIEYIQLIKNLWENHPSTFKGNYYSFSDVTFYPKPKQKKLPIWMGGNSDHVIERALEHADGWQPIWFSTNELRDKISFLHKIAGEKSINIDDFDISLRNRIQLTAHRGTDDRPPSALIGSKEEIFEKILSYGDLRIKEVVLDFITPNKNETIETMQILSEELIPNL